MAVPAQQKKEPSQIQSISKFMNGDSVKSKFAEVMGRNSSAFISSLLTAVKQSSNLQNATPESIYSSALMSATLDLPINQSLGFAYLVPYNRSIKNEDGSWGKIQEAQFQLGYKGYIQLAQRSGQFKTISATPIYDGQVLSSDPLKGYEFDFTKPSTGSVVGYAAYFSLINGFEKTIYMTKKELESHGKNYSKSFDDAKALWKSNFDAMAIKTVIKLLLSKYAPLSVEMQKAIIADSSVINDADTLDVSYVDNDAGSHEQQAKSKADKAASSVTGSLGLNNTTKQ